MKIGTMSILFREQLHSSDHIGYVESMTRIAKAGFESVDLNLCQLCAHKTTLHGDDWRQETEKIADAAAQLGLAMPQCHLPFKSEKVKWREPQDYAYYIEMFYRAIDVASMLGIPWAVIHPEIDNEHDASDLDARILTTRREYDKLIEYALKKSLNIAYENMRGTAKDPTRFCALAEELAALVDSYRDDRIGVCWDTGHANGSYRGGDQWDALHVIGNRLHCTHIHDNRGTDDLHLLPWEGKIDWQSVMDALRDIGYPGDMILEPSANYFTPEALKDETARHAFEVARYLVTL